MKFLQTIACLSAIIMTSVSAAPVRDSNAIKAREVDLGCTGGDSGCYIKKREVDLGCAGGDSGCYIKKREVDLGCTGGDSGCYIKV